MERAMQRASKSSSPGTPRSLEEFAQSLDLWIERFGEVNNEQFCLGLFGSGDEQCIIAKVTPIANSLDFDKNANWHLDGTFKCRPKSPKMCQLYVIMSSQYGRAVPIIWALMTTRTVKAYDVLFEAVKQHIPGINPSVIMSDYEKAVRSSLEKHFPTATHVGCWFHFSQAIERKARKIGIACGGTGDGQIITKRLMATALLPHEKVDEAVSILDAQSLTLSDREKAKLMLGYFKKEWIQKVTAKSFSVHGQNERTNNCQESLNRRINTTIRPQGNTWDFWTGLQSISTKEINNFVNMKNGVATSRNKKNKWLLQDRSIRILQERLTRGDMSTEQFLCAASHRIVESRPPNPDVYEDDENDDDTELTTLDVLAGNVAEPQRDQVVAAAPGTAVLEDDLPELAAIIGMETADGGLRSYRILPINLNIETLADVPSRGFVNTQRAELANNLSENEELVQVTEAGERPCPTCMSHKATRVFSPCGHRAGCIECCRQFLHTQRFFMSITLNGDHREEFDCPLPYRCYQCNALVGSIMRLYD